MPVQRRSGRELCVLAVARATSGRALPSRCGVVGSNAAWPAMPVISRSWRSATHRR